MVFCHCIREPGLTVDLSLNDGYQMTQILVFI